MWVKDETRNVSGSHKARHLFGLLLQLELAEPLGLPDPAPRPASRSRAAATPPSAAARVAAAGERPLRVFVPVDADPFVVDQLDRLGADVRVCPRDPGARGDPTYPALREAIEHGAASVHLPGQPATASPSKAARRSATRWLRSSASPAPRSTGSSSRSAAARWPAPSPSRCTRPSCSGALGHRPRLDTIQTTGAWPLRRAYDLVASYGNHALAYAATHRSEFMWPWEPEPHSIAGGILDDETYDWLAVVEGMLMTGGRPVIATEATLAEAHMLAHAATGIDVDPTGASGLAGLLALRASDRVADGERVAVLFTGITRTHTHRKESRDEELPRARHPVA